MSSPFAVSSKQPPPAGISVKAVIFCLKLVRSLAVRLTAFGSYPQTEQYFSSMFMEIPTVAEIEGSSRVLYATKQVRPEHEVRGVRSWRAWFADRIQSAFWLPSRVVKNCRRPSLGPPVWTIT